MRPIDADEFMEQYNLKDATKYGNKDAEQQNHSYSTLYLYELAGMIDDAHTIDIYGKWIPCSERLPDSGTEVLVTLGYTYESDYTMYSIARYIKFEDGECHWCDNRYGYLEWDKYSDGKGGNSRYKVVAWMPLPELYRGE